MPKNSADYPLRAVQHVSETKAIALFRKRLPSAWVIRELSERDYGLDALVEIPTKGRMMGKVIAAQLKGDATLTLAHRDIVNISKLEASTYNYLLDLPVPSYLFVVAHTDKAIYWASLRAHQRQTQTAGKPLIQLRRGQDFSKSGLLALRQSQRLESIWPQVEAAVVGALMAFNGLGPIYLGCKRGDPTAPVPSTVQFLLTQHYTFNRLLQRHLAGGAPNAIPSLKAVYRRAVAGGQLTSRGVFTHQFANETFQSFVSGYLDVIHQAFALVTDTQRSYWKSRYPQLLLHLDLFGPVFNDEDWFPRYHFDEFENETSHVSLAMFEDLDELTRRTLNGDW